jgi:hypothetical protein
MAGISISTLVNSTAIPLIRAILNRSDNGTPQPTKPKGDKMSFNDLYKHGRNRHHDDHGYYGGHGDSHHGGLERCFYLFEKMKSNKKLLLVLSLAAIVIIIVIIALIDMLIPTIIKMFETVQKGGIKGLIETVRPLLDLLWSGKGK